MLGPEKAKFLAGCVAEAKPSLIVECGTAIGYSGLWMLRVLKAAGTGRLITVEIDADRAAQARANFERAEWVISLTRVSVMHRKYSKASKNPSISCSLITILATIFRVFRRLNRG